VFSVEEN